MTKEETLKGLDDLYNLIEKQLCKGVMARDIYGNEVDLHSPLAASFCLLGGLDKLNLSGTQASNQLYSLCREIEGHNYHGITFFNDNHTKEQVLALISETKNRVNNAK